LLRPAESSLIWINEIGILDAELITGHGENAPAREPARHRCGVSGEKCLYSLLKTVHVGAAVLSFTLFFIRGIWMLGWPRLLQRKAVRIVPHVVDTILLASALLLAWQLGQYPFVDGWLTAKVFALLVYIVLGSIALKRGRTRGIRTTAWLLALATFTYIVAVAVTRQVVPFAG